MAARPRESAPAAPVRRRQLRPPPEDAGQYDVEPGAAARPKKHKPVPAPAKPKPKAPPPPPAAPGQTRLMVVELQRKNRTLMLGVAGAVLALVLGGGGTGVYLVVSLRNLSTRTTTLDEIANMMNEKTSALDDNTHNLNQKTTTLDENTKNLNAKVGKVASSVEKLSKSDEENIFNRYGDAVFLVALYKKSGEVIPFGTAFAVDDKGKLATNAHVALPVQGFLKKGWKVCTISPGGKKEFPVIGRGLASRLYRLAAREGDRLSDPRCRRAHR